MANVKDGATSLVATAPSPATSGTSVVVSAGEGTLFPAVPFYAVFHPQNTLPTIAVAEKVLVTARSTDTFTIVRAQGVYTAKSVAVGWRFSNAIFQEDINNSSIIQNEIPGGLVNSSNTAYTLASATGMLSGSLRVYKNGIRLKGGGADFTETSTGFTATSAPTTGAVLLADYNVNGAINNVGTNSLITDEVPTGTVNGSTTLFTLSRAYIGGSLEVFINGVKQKRVTHFTETSPSAGTFTMGDAPLTGDDIMVNYAFNLNPSSNSDTVDGIHANTTATANMLMPLDSNAKFSSSLLANPYKFSVYRNAAANAGNSTFVNTIFDTKIFDTGNNVSTSTGIFTVPVAGFYQFSWQLGTGATTTRLIASLSKNSTSVEWHRGSDVTTSANFASSSGSALVQLAAGDTVGVMSFSGSGATALAVGGQNQNYFTGMLVSTL